MCLQVGKYGIKNGRNTAVVFGTNTMIGCSGQEWERGDGGHCGGGQLGEEAAAHGS